MITNKSRLVALANSKRAPFVGLGKQPKITHLLVLVNRQLASCVGAGKRQTRYICGYRETANTPRLLVLASNQHASFVNAGKKSNTLYLWMVNSQHASCGAPGGGQYASFEGAGKQKTRLIWEC